MAFRWLNSSRKYLKSARFQLSLTRPLRMLSLISSKWLPLAIPLIIRTLITQIFTWTILSWWTLLLNRQFSNNNAGELRYKGLKLLIWCLTKELRAWCQWQVLNTRPKIVKNIGPATTMRWWWTFSQTTTSSSIKLSLRVQKERTSRHFTRMRIKVTTLFVSRTIYLTERHSFF